MKAKLLLSTGLYVWGIIVLSIGAFVLALRLFVSEEQTAGGLPDRLALAYMLGGKRGLPALFLPLAAVFFGLEIRDRRHRRRSPQSTAEFDGDDR